MAHVERWVQRWLSMYDYRWVNSQTRETLDGEQFVQRFEMPPSLCEGLIDEDYQADMVIESSVIYINCSDRGKVLGILYISINQDQKSVWYCKLLCGQGKVAPILKQALMDWEADPEAILIALSCRFDLISYYRRYGFKLGSSCRDDATLTLEFPEHFRAKQYTTKDMLQYKDKYAHLQDDPDEDFKLDTLFNMVKCKTGY